MDKESYNEGKKLLSKTINRTLQNPKLLKELTVQQLQSLKATTSFHIAVETEKNLSDQYQILLNLIQQELDKRKKQIQDLKKSSYFLILKYLPEQVSVIGLLIAGGSYLNGILQWWILLIIGLVSGIAYFFLCPIYRIWIYKHYIEKVNQQNNNPVQKIMIDESQQVSNKQIEIEMIQVQPILT